MIVGFAAWSIVSPLPLGVGIRTLKSDETAGLYTGVKPPEVTDIRQYNRAVAALWFVYAALFELPGFPFVFPKQDSLGFLWCLPVIPLITVVHISFTTGFRKDAERNNKRPAETGS